MQKPKKEKKKGPTPNLYFTFEQNLSLSIKATCLPMAPPAFLGLNDLNSHFFPPPHKPLNLNAQDCTIHSHTLLLSSLQCSIQGYSVKPSQIRDQLTHTNNVISSFNPICSPLYKETRPAYPSTHIPSKEVKPGRKTHFHPMCRHNRQRAFHSDKTRGPPDSTGCEWTHRTPTCQGGLCGA